MEREEAEESGEEEEQEPKEGDHVPVAQAAVGPWQGPLPLSLLLVLSVQFRFIFYAFMVSSSRPYFVPS